MSSHAKALGQMIVAVFPNEKWINVTDKEGERQSLLGEVKEVTRDSGL